MYLYAATCVEQKRTPFFEDIRDWPKEREQHENTTANQ
jgi:hypothetical protein